uniref:MTMR6-9 GRAM domain-containing protein n=1 Tax=Monodelphis domestica TaxID=13616 RepID=A0A5F8HJP3_MONDO
MEMLRAPVENVRLMDRTSSKKPVLGTLYLTATHVIFVENEPETRKETWILHSEISSIEKQATTAGGCPLLIRCKNFQVLHLVVPQERDCQDVYISLLRLARPGRARGQGWELGAGALAGAHPPDCVASVPMSLSFPKNNLRYLSTAVTIFCT